MRCSPAYLITPALLMRDGQFRAKTHSELMAGWPVRDATQIPEFRLELVGIGSTGPVHNRGRRIGTEALMQVACSLRINTECGLCK